MGGIEGAARAPASDWEEVQRRQAAACGSGSTARANSAGSLAPWAHDPSSIPEAVRAYDPSMFANPALGAAAPAAARPTTIMGTTPDPLPPAADAYHGIRLLCLEDDLPPMTRTDARSAMRAGPYTLQPAVREHEDGSVSVLYWTAVNREARRGEFVIGPDAVDAFKRSVTDYERAGATAYMNGEPNEWQRESMRVVDDAMVVHVAGTRTVLVRDATTGHGFRILTAYPIK